MRTLPLLFSAMLAFIVQAQAVSTWRNIADARPLNSVWMASSTTGWAVGDAGLLSQTTDGGTTWTKLASGTTENLNGIWGVDATHVWAVGDRGTILFCDGSTWANQTSGTSNNLYGVLASTVNNVLVIGQSGTVRASTDGGANWGNGPASGVTTNLRSITSTDATHFWICGDSGVIRFYNGSGNFTAQTSGTAQALNSIYAVTTTKVVAVGARTTYDISNNGTSWTDQSAPTPPNSFSSIWASDDANVWFAGTGGVTMRYDGTAFTTPATGVNQALSDIWGADASHVWSVGANGTVIFWNGTSWATQNSGSTQQLNSVHGASATDVWAVGNAGTILHFNGTTWAAQTSGVTVNLNSVWSSGAGVAWAVGANGTILKLTSGVWKAQTSGMNAALNEVMGASSTAIWASGANGTILKYNGTSWAAQTSGTTTALAALAVVTSTSQWAMGNTIIQRGTGTAWAADGTTGFPYAINAAFGTSVNSVFLVTAGGMIFTNQPASHPEIAVEQPAGTGLQSAVSTINFGNVVTPNSATLTVTIKSTGTADLTGLGISRTGTGASYFTLGTLSSTTLTAGNSTTFDITFTPPSDGLRTATLTIVSNDLDEPLFTLTLSGTGVVPVTYSTQPVSKTLNPNAAVSLSAVVSTLATKPVTYQWQRFNTGSMLWEDVTGATAATYSIAHVLESQEGDYRLNSTNAASGTPVSSNVVTISVNDPVVIVTPPVAQTVAVGQPFTFTVAATGTGLKYQWRRNGSSISGATSSSYHVDSALLTQAGDYSVVVSNVVNSATTPATPVPAATLSVIDGTLKTLILPTGGKATITASYSGKLAAVNPFVWKKDGNPITDIRATFPKNVLTITPLQVTPVSDSALYTCDITTADGGMVTSSTRLIVYSGLPVITGADPLILPDAMVDDPNYSYQIPYSSLDAMLDPDKLQMPTTFSVSGLPSGLKYSSTSGLITGKPVVSLTADKLYALTITVSNAKGKATRKAQLTLKALPADAVGTYTGPVNPDPVLNKNLGGRMDVTVSSNGYYSGKVTLGASATSFSGYLVADIAHPKESVASVSVKRTGLPNLNITFTTDPDNHALKVCDVNDGTNHAAFSAWRKRWGTVMPLADSDTLKHYLGYYTLILEAPVPVVTAPTVPEELVPQGWSYAYFTVSSSGSLTVTGKLADGSTTFTCATYCGPTGQVLVYKALYSNLGSVLGTLDINEGTPGFVPPYGDNPLTGTVRWLRPAITTSSNHVYRAGFGPIDLTATGGRYVAPVSPALLLGATENGGNNAALSFTSGGLAGTSTDVLGTLYLPDVPGLRIKAGGTVTVPAHNTMLPVDPNPRSTTLGTIPVSTGVFSGKASLVDQNPIATGSNITRSLSYYGIIYRDGPAMKGKGWFLLAKRPAVLGQTTSTTDQLSGRVSLDKL